MQIQTGNPTQSGHYAVYLDGETAAHTLCFWLAGSEPQWISNMKKPLPADTKITGWYGPMPLREPQPRKVQAPTPRVFDL